MRVIVYQASDTSALSKNFTRKDFKCPCGCSRQMVDSELVEKLQTIRDKLGKPIKVTSGYRCIPPQCGGRRQFRQQAPLRYGG